MTLSPLTSPADVADVMALRRKQAPPVRRKDAAVNLSEYQTEEEEEEED